MDRIEELEAELAELRKVKKTEEDERRASVKAKYTFTAEPSKRTWDKVYDPACRLYDISGKIVNKDELEAVGHRSHGFEGGMAFIFNSLSGLLVAGVGGGTTYTSDAECYEEISAFLVANPEGGDITSIVERYRP